MGSTVGIIGASRVGREVIRLLRAFHHVRVLLNDPYVTADEAKILGAKLVQNWWTWKRCLPKATSFRFTLP